MIIIIGLGNPGEKYKKTRHNLGFLVLESFREKNNFPDFKLSKNFNSLISEGVIDDKKIILAKPQTFMNLSGSSVKKLTTNYPPASASSAGEWRAGKLQTTNLIVVHDDIDLPFGEIKIVRNRGSAGHKGVESIIKNLGTKDFTRMRIGILPVSGKPKNPENFVIKNFSKEEKENFEKNLEKTSCAIKSFMSQSLEKTMNEYNKKSD